LTMTMKDERTRLTCPSQECGYADVLPYERDDER